MTFFRLLRRVSMSPRLDIDPGQVSLPPVPSPVTDQRGKDPVVFRRLADIGLPLGPEYTPHRIGSSRRDHAIEEPTRCHTVGGTRPFRVATVLITLCPRGIERKRLERIRTQPGFSRRIRDRRVDQSDRYMKVVIKLYGKKISERRKGKDRTGRSRFPPA